MEEFEDYLKGKKIDSKAFKEKEPERWEEWLHLFERVHPNSFSQQKLFLINSTRRKYPIKEDEKEAEANTTKAKPKPKIKISVRPRKKED
ncbi:hypothetical protein PZB74_03265 [Porifericola rhodea]|uniref:hypothetical protein n=1 Tax=Porifericola rhodea TaxID=930972 RepID=UPI002666E4CE|nr:hypothetical protein [Porifericola rhodea]WKN33989.1 hypothetical protein PZB74_03265 [Porifericola rhodea]